jgi:hypothetical protein
MSESETEQPILSSSIGHHGAYIWETKRIFDEYVDCESIDDVRNRVVEDNILNKSSERYRKSIFEEVIRRYIPNRDQYEETPLITLITGPVSELVQDWALYYEYSNDDLVRTLTQEFLYPKYQKGALSIDKSDIVPFLNKLEEEHPEIEDWSEQTREQVSKHYLAALKNFDLLEGQQTKEFKYVYPPDEIVAYVLYTLFQQDMTTADEIVNHREWRLLLLDPEDVRQRLQDLSPEYIRYEKRGNVERIEPKFASLSEVIDEF